MLLVMLLMFYMLSPVRYLLRRLCFLKTFQQLFVFKVDGLVPTLALVFIQA